MKRAVVFGAGQIGRAFLGDLLTASGYAVTFVDVVPAIVEALKSRSSYEIDIVGPGARKVLVQNVSAIDGRDAEAASDCVARADLAATAVGNAALVHIAPNVAAGLEKRRLASGGPLDTIVCENLLHSGHIFKAMVLERMTPEGARWAGENFGAAEAVISRMVPVVPEEIARRDPLYIRCEAYAKLPVDSTAFKGPIPAIEGLIASDRLIAYQERKLFTHNAGHALLAYAGYLRGCEYIWQTLEIPELRRHAYEGLWETGEALIRRHGFTRQEHERHIQDLFARFAVKELADQVSRVGRDSARKLGRADRLVGAALLALEGPRKPAHLVGGILDAMRFDAPGDPSAARVRALFTSGGSEAVLREISGLSEADELFQMVLSQARQIGLRLEAGGVRKG